MPSEPRNRFEEETDRDFDDIERITRTFVHYAKGFVITLPLWLSLLVLLPRWGLAEMPSLVGASLIAGGLAIGGARMFRRTSPQGATRGRLRVTPPGRVTLVGLTLVVVLYVVLVLRAGA